MQTLRTTLAAAIAATTLLLTAGASAASPSSDVVGPHATVDGKGYGYFAGKIWQLIFEAPAHHPSNCGTITVAGHQVAMVAASTNGSGSFTQTCTEPAGRPVYLQHLDNECSTFKGDHAGFGTSAGQLKACARAPFKNATGSTTVDGAKIADPDDYLAASGVYAINLHKSNHFGYTKLHGRSAAYGYGVLLRGLSPGIHKIVVAGKVPSFKVHLTITYTIKVS